MAAVGAFFWYGGNFASNKPDPAQLVDEHLTSRARQELCGLPNEDGHPTTIEMLHSDNLRGWLDQALERFSYLCPSIQVKLTALSDLEAANAILAQRVRPTIWAPDDELSLSYLDYNAKQYPSEPPLRFSERIDLVQSPVVVLMWQDRLRMLTKLLTETPSPDGQWSRSLCALIPKEPVPTELHLESMVPGRWADWFASLLPTDRLNGLPRGQTRPPARPGSRPSAEDETLHTLEQWGHVKLGHANPTKDSAGLAALYLLAYDYLLPTRAETETGTDRSSAPAAEAPAATQSGGQITPALDGILGTRKDALQRWLRRCEAGLEEIPSDARSLTEALSYGPARYDGVVTYEHLALPLFERVESHPSGLHKLVLIYPKPMLLARHPAVILDGNDAQRLVAQRWLRFLIGPEMQQKAMDVGFRPVNTAVSLRDATKGPNPFLRLRRYGVVLEPRYLEAPRAGGKTVQELIQIWSEATGRN